MKKSSVSMTPHILLIEDDQTVQMVYQYYLKKLGLQVSIASTGKKALQCVSSLKYHAIILDLGLPDMHGEIVLEKIRYLEKANEMRVPIIVSTAHSDAEQLMECYHKGAHAAFVKPVSFLTFYQVFSEINLISSTRA